MDTYTPDIGMAHAHGGMDMQHGHAAWTWIYSMEMQHRCGLAEWTWIFSMHLDMQL
jgi:hypothetical protein